MKTKTCLLGASLLLLTGCLPDASIANPTQNEGWNLGHEVQYDGWVTTVLRSFVVPAEIYPDSNIVWSLECPDLPINNRTLGVGRVVNATFRFIPDADQGFEACKVHLEATSFDGTVLTDMKDVQIQHPPM